MDNLAGRKAAGRAGVPKGWLVVVGCMLIQAIPFGVASNIQPQFISYVVEGEGFSLASFSFLFTVGTFVSALASPAIGYIYGRVNVRLMFFVGSLLCGLGFMLFAFSHSLWQFYTVAAIVQIGAAIISSIGVPLLINAWFGEKMRGKALGIAFAGGSIGNVFLQTMVATSLAQYGYGWSYFMYGLLALIVGVPLALLAVRFPRKGEAIIGEAADGEQASAKVDEWGYTLKEVQQEKDFWLILIGFIFLGIYISALAVQYPAYLKGYLHLDATIVGLVGSTFALFSLFGNVGGGVVFDRMGPMKGLVIAGVLAAVACVSLLLTPYLSVMAFVFAAAKGASVFAYMLGPAYLTGSLFGKKEYGAILGMITLGFAVGFSAGSYVFGLMVDYGSYFIAWSAMLVCIFIGYALVLYAVKRLLAKRTARMTQPSRS